MADNRWREDDRRWRSEDPVRRAERGYGQDYAGYDASRYDRDHALADRPDPSNDYGTRRSYGEDHAQDYRRQRYGAASVGHDQDRPYGTGDYSRGPGYAADYGSHRRDWRGETRYRGYDDDRSDRRAWNPDRSWWDRASDEVSSWMGDEDAERRRALDDAQRGHYGRGPRGYVRSDERIREDINDRLTDDWGVDASDIEVVVSSCEVTLSGTVHTRREKRRAEDIAESVSGVQQVQNNIRVRTSAAAASAPSASEETLGSGTVIGSMTAVDTTRSS
jgi:osmotically-inducible protein OsmY